MFFFNSLAKEICRRCILAGISSFSYSKHSSSHSAKLFGDFRPLLPFLFIRDVLPFSYGIFTLLQNLQERIASLQNMFETLSSTEGELRRKGVSLSPTLQNRIDQLYRRWKQLQIQLLQRQHAMQEAYSSIDMSSIQGLQGQLYRPIKSM